MNLHAKLLQRAAAGRPVRAGLIGAGEFGAMYHAQVPRTPGVQVVAIADLSPAAARRNLARVGWPEETTAARSIGEAAAQGRTHLGEDWRALVAHPAVDVVIAWRADVVATAKRDLAAGEKLDGEGGSTVWGKLLPAERSLATGGLPLGLAHDVKLLRPVMQGQCLSWDDVAVDTATEAYRLRRAMEDRFAPQRARVAEGAAAPPAR